MIRQPFATVMALLLSNKNLKIWLYPRTEKADVQKKAVIKLPSCISLSHYECEMSKITVTFVTIFVFSTMGKVRVSRHF